MHERWILHIDMDAFFAAVEVLDDPRLAGKAVIVGGTPEGHGVVSTANYEARKFGVHSAMPAAQAVRLCPHGIFVRPRPGRYGEISRQVFALFREYTPLVEPLSIDEAFLDVTGCHALKRVPTDGPQTTLDGTRDVAREIQARVQTETGGLTCSIGIAENKFLAKMASDLRKPNGIVLVPRGEAKSFLADLQIERLWGVGPRTAERLHAAGIVKIGDVSRRQLPDLEQLLGAELGRHLHRLSHGVDKRPVNIASDVKSISNETTFANFIPAGDVDAITNVLYSLSHQVATRLRQQRLWGRTVTLKVRDERFKTVTRSKTLPTSTRFVEEIFGVAESLFREKVELGRRRVRLLGVGVTQLDSEPRRQLDLFDTGTKTRERTDGLAEAEAAVRGRLGADAITRGRLIGKRRRR